MPFSCLVPHFVTLYETYFPFSCSRREHFSTGYIISVPVHANKLSNSFPHIYGIPYAVLLFYANASEEKANTVNKTRGLRSVSRISDNGRLLGVHRAEGSGRDSEWRGPNPKTRGVLAN